MKRTELVSIIAIALASVGVAYFVANSVFGSIQNESVKVKTIEEIDPSFAEVDKTIFNDQAINPTVQVQITGESAPQESDTQTDPDTEQE